MKNKILLFGIMLMTIVLSVSCENEGDISKSASGQINVYGTSYPLLSGVIWQSNKNVVIGREEYIWQDKYTTNSGTDTTVDVKGFFMSAEKAESGNFVISLYGEGLVYSSDISLTKGNGAVVSFHIASEDLNSLKPGKYTFSTSKMPGTFLGYMSTNYNMSFNDGERVAYMVDGVLTVEDNGSEKYTVKFDGKLDSKLPLKVNYSGSMGKCLVEQQQMSSVSGLYLHGISPKLTVQTLVFGSDYGTESQDDNKSKGLYLGSSASSDKSTTTHKDKVELFLAYDTISTKLSLRSPITMRGFLSHQDKFNLPCHTIYMKAPDTFTDADFDNLEKTGLNFVINNPENVEFSTDDTFEPGYVFFSAGTGISGVIRLKGIVPSFDIAEVNNYYTYNYTTNPYLVCDIKAQSNFSNPLIR